MGRRRFSIGESGQVVPLSAVLLGLGAAMSVVAVHLGAGAANQARASAAADASALAAIVAGADGAAAMAEENGARLAGLVVDGRFASVHAHVAGRVATAAAEAMGPSPAVGLAPEMVSAIAEAERLLGRPLPIVSGFRSTAQQASLWRSRATNPLPVARPGTSLHERGLAIDVAAEVVPSLRAVAGHVGLCQPLPTADPVHFELCRTTATR